MITIIHVKSSCLEKLHFDVENVPTGLTRLENRLARNHPGEECFVLEGDVPMHRILSSLDARQRYLLLLLADLGTAVFSAKLIVRVTGLFLEYAWLQSPQMAALK
jgi:hypothetical protein